MPSGSSRCSTRTGRHRPGRPHAAAPRRRHPALQQVTFTYPDTERPALSGIDLRISPGEKVAVVGASGAGKTTLTKLLLRFYDPDDGRITLDGHDLRDLSLSDLRRNVAAVLQETLVFDGTIADNIRWGRPDATDHEIERAARAADVHRFVQDLPDRYATRVGPARSPALRRPAAAARHRAGHDPRRPRAAPRRADHGPRRGVERTGPRPAAPAHGRPDHPDDLPQPADRDRRRPDRLPRGRPDHRRRHAHRAAGPQPGLRPPLPAAPSRRRGAADGHRRPALHGPSSRARLRDARSAAVPGAEIRSRPAAPGRRAATRRDGRSFRPRDRRRGRRDVHQLVRSGPADPADPPAPRRARTAERAAAPTPRHRTRSRCRPPVPPSRDGTRRWPAPPATTPCRNRRSGRDRRDRRPAAAPTTVRRHPRRSPRPLPARTRARHRRARPYAGSVVLSPVRLGGRRARRRPRRPRRPPARRPHRRRPVHRLRHPGLPRALVAPAQADDLHRVRLRPGRTTPLLGAQPRRLGPHGPRPAQPWPPGARRPGVRRACCAA